MNKYVAIPVISLVSFASFVGGVEVKDRVGQYQETLQQNAELQIKVDELLVKLEEATKELSNRGELVYQHSDCESPPTT